MVKNNKMKLFLIFFVSALVLTSTTNISEFGNRVEGGEIIWTYDADLFVKHIKSADLNDDGIEDIISAEYDSEHYDDISKVYGINGIDGSNLWTYSLNDGARSMTIGDINNDGVMDAVIGASKGSTTPDGRVHAIDGTDGSEIWIYTPGSNGDTIGDVEIGDFNGDAYPDIAVACWDDFVYAVNGEDGSELWNYEIDSIFVNAVSTADVTGDGIDDVSYAHEYLTGWDNEIGVLNGTNGAVVWNLITENAGKDTLLLDIDDDGDVEAIFGVEKDNDEVEVQVRDGLNGDLEWASIIGSSSGTSPDVYLFYFDVDKDSDDDLVVGNAYIDYYIRAYNGHNSSLLWLSEELNGYPRHISFGDVNGDGDVNAVVATYDRVQVINAKDGTKSWYLSVAGTIGGTSVGNFDDDDIYDVACSGGAEFSGNDPAKAVWAIKTNESPILWEFNVEEYGNAIALGDFTGDITLDVIGVTSNDKAWAIHGPTGELLWQWTGTANLYTVCTGDFNGDGIEDAAVAGDDDQVTALNGIDGSLLWQFTTPSNQFYRKCLKSTDLTNDGKIDVIGGCDDSFVYAINGENGSLIWSIDLDGSVRDIDLYQMNSEGVLDVVAAASNEIAVIDGSDGTKLWDYSNGVSSAKHAVILDVNNDEIMDVAWGSYTNLALIDGSSQTELWSISTSVNSDYCLASGDMNNDSIPDVILGGGSTDQDVIALHGMNGTTIWEFPTGGDINYVDTSNLDDDEELEVLAGSDDQYIYVIDPNGTELWSYPTADDLMHAGVGDITGDSKEDIVAITFGFDGIVYAFQSLSFYQTLIADFTYLPINPTIEDIIQFNDTSTSHEGAIISWNWNFDDGNTSNITNPTHNYSIPGDYTVCLTITNELEKNDTICKIIHIYDVGEEMSDINQSIYDRGFPIRHAIDGDWAAAQNYIPTVNTITRVEISMRKFGTPEFNLTVELREDHPQGVLLDAKVFTPNEVPSSWDWFTVDFDDATVTPDTEYFIVCPPAPSGVTTSFGYEWRYAFGNQYDDGAFWFTRDGGGLWRDLPTMYEFVFRTYGYN